MRLLFAITLLFCTLCASAQTASREQTFNVAGKDMHMKQYYFVMLIDGEAHNKISDSSALAQLQMAHLLNIRKLMEAKKVLAVGPFGDDTYKRGIFVFDCDTEEEVITLLKGDPMVMAGYYAYDIHPWWTEKNCLFQ